MSSISISPRLQVENLKSREPELTFRPGPSPSSTIKLNSGFRLLPCYEQQQRSQAYVSPFFFPSSPSRSLTLSPPRFSSLILPVALGSVLGFFVLLSGGLLLLFFRRRRRRNEEALEAEKLDHLSYSLTPFAPRQSILADTEATEVVVQGLEAATTTSTTAGRRRSFRLEDESREDEQMGNLMTRELGGGGEEDNVLERKLEGWKAVAVAREDDVAGSSQWGDERRKQNPFGDSNAVYNNCESTSFLNLFSLVSTSSSSSSSFLDASSLRSNILPSPSLFFLSPTTTHQHLDFFFLLSSPTSILHLPSKPSLLLQLSNEPFRLLHLTELPLPSSQSHHLLPADRHLRLYLSSPASRSWSQSAAGRGRWYQLDALRTPRIRVGEEEDQF